MPYSGQLWGPNVMSAASADNEGTLAWSAGAGSSAVANSATQFNSGAQSVQCTRNAVTTGALMVNNTTEIPVVAGTTYYLTFAVFMTDTAGTLNVNFEWYTSGQVFVNSSTLPTITLVQNQWTVYPAAAVTIGATGAFARINPQRVSGLATTTFVYFDTFSLATLLRPAAQNIAPAQPMRSAVW